MQCKNQNRVLLFRTENQLPCLRPTPQFAGGVGSYMWYVNKCGTLCRDHHPFHVPRNQTHVPWTIVKEYVRFHLGNPHLQYNILPHNLSSVPRMFMKCLTLVADNYRGRGICVFFYLYNWLFQATSQWEFLWSLDLTCQLFLITCNSITWDHFSMPCLSETQLYRHQTRFRDSTPARRKKSLHFPNRRFHNSNPAK